ncbi:MAG: acyl-CoA carboxylase subunit epsilon [Phycicoccus sp.]|nr:acyl-CoA carboxylase subunit epsilon [Phycicoccus sp.]
MAPTPSAEPATPAATAFAVPAGTTAEQVATIAVVLLAAGSPADPAPTPQSAWGDPAQGLRAPLTPGRGAWHRSSLPR